MYTYIHNYCLVTGHPSSNPEDVDYVPSVFVFSNPSQCRREKCKEKTIESNHQIQLAKEAAIPRNIGVQAVSATASVLVSKQKF